MTWCFLFNAMYVWRLLAMAENVAGGCDLVNLIDFLHWWWNIFNLQNELHFLIIIFKENSKCRRKFTQFFPTQEIMWGLIFTIKRITHLIDFFFFALASKIDLVCTQNKKAIEQKNSLIVHQIGCLNFPCNMYFSSQFTLFLSFYKRFTNL